MASIRAIRKRTRAKLAEHIHRRWIERKFAPVAMFMVDSLDKFASAVVEATAAADNALQALRESREGRGANRPEIVQPGAS